MAEITLRFEVEECSETRRVVSDEYTYYWFNTGNHVVAITKWHSPQISVHISTQGLIGHRKFDLPFTIQINKLVDFLFRVIDMGEEGIRLEKLTQKTEAGSSV